VLRSWAAIAEPRRETDDTLPGLVLCRVAEVTGDERLLKAALVHATWLLERPQVQRLPISLSRAPLRRPFGGASLPPGDIPYLLDPGPAVVIDSLHFGPPFLAALGRLSGRSTLCDAAAAQARAYLDLLQDESGLVWHLWLERAGRRFGYGWGRGQGWAALGLADVLMAIGPQHRDAGYLRSGFARLAESLAAAQLPDGTFPIVVSEPASRSEASTAAFAASAFARGVRLGWLDRSYAEHAERAWRATWERVDAHGVLLDVSAEVHASTGESHYSATPTGFVVPWSQGPMLVAALEIARLRRESTVSG
jgi:unsaturated rhamnogalacturonyl hydrolase